MKHFPVSSVAPRESLQSVFFAQGVVGDALDPVLHAGLTEIQEQSDFQPALCQFLGQYRILSTFQEARPNFGMYFAGGINDGGRDFIYRSIIFHASHRATEATKIKIINGFPSVTSVPPCAKPDL